MMQSLILFSISYAADWRFQLGGEFNPDSHGILDLGYRDELIQIELLTNTLDIKREIKNNSGRKWGSLRGEAVMTGLLPFPWKDGQPVPELGSDASQGGLELGGIRYYQWSMYAGGVVQFNQQWFNHSAESQFSDSLNNRFVTHPKIILGRYTENFHAYMHIGTYFIDIDTDNIQNAIQAKLDWQPNWTIAPTLQTFAGTGENLDAMNQFRVGGLNPYVIPVAGAGWGEWWVESYAACQLGVQAKWNIRTTQGQFKPFIDMALFDNQSAMGFGSTLTAKHKDWFTVLSWGWAPWIERAPNIGRHSIWFTFGQNYTKVRQLKD